MKFQIKPFSFKKGIGNEIILMGAVLLFVSMFVAVLTWYGGYTASIEGQILSDVVADGSVRFAKADMQIFEDGLQAMAKKLFDKNQELVNSLGFCTVSGYSIKLTPLSEIGGSSSYFSAAENTYLTKRNTIKTGALKTMVFKFSLANLYKGKAGSDFDDKVLDEITTHDAERGISKPGSSSTGATFDVPYVGPAFNDQLVTVTVTSSSSIPFLNKLFLRTGTSTVLSRADVPYNSRASQQASGLHYSMLRTLERAAFAGVYKNGIIDINSGRLPVYGSIQQQAILNAIRYLADGYFRGGPNSLQAWPFTKLDGTFVNGSQKNNQYKDCYNFVSASYSMHGYGQPLYQTMGEYGSTTLTREVQLKRLIPAEDLWDQLHGEKGFTHTIRGGNTTLTLMLYNLHQVLKGHPEWCKSSIVFASSVSGGWSVCKSDGSTYWITHVNKEGKTEVAKREDFTMSRNGNVLTFTPKKEGMSLAEAMGKYAPDGGVDGNAGTALWDIAGYEQWTEGKLEPGDVLVFINPNWQPIVAAELIQIYNAKHREDVMSLNNPAGRSFVCHFALYIGGSKIAEGTTSSQANGGQVQALRGLKKAPGSTSIVKSIYRLPIVSPKKSGSGSGSSEDYENYINNAQEQK